MDKKMLAVIGMLALAFALVPIAMDQSDADGNTMTSTEKVYVDPTGTGSGTATITVTLGAAPAAEITVNAVSSDDGKATVDNSKTIGTSSTTATFTVTFVANGSVTITFTSEGYPTTVSTVYLGIQQLDGPAYFLVQNSSETKTVTFKGNIPANLSLNAASTATVSQLGSLSVATTTEGQAVLTTAPTASFIGSEIVQIKNGSTVVGQIIVYSAQAAAMGYVANSNVQAMVFSDAVIYMDTSAIDTSQKPMVYFEISYDADGDGTGAAITKSLGPIAAQKRMTIEIPGYIHFDGTATTTIAIKNWSDKSAIATFTDMKFSTPITFNLDKNMPVEGYKAYKHDGETEFVGAYPATGQIVTRATTVDTFIMSPSFTFLGWASAADATEPSFPNLVIGESTGGTGYKAAPTVSEYFFATNGNKSGDVYKIFAIWDDKLTIEVLYLNATGKLNELYYENVYKSGDVPGTADPTAKVLQVPSYAKVGDSFLLRIQQQVAGNYTYSVNLYTSYTNETTKTVATLESARMITNGVWLIEGLSENIKIVVTATTSAGPVTGYHFMIDEVTSGAANTAKLSWDAVDYKPAGDIKIGGTYFHQITGIGNVYGDLSLLEDVGGLTYDLTVDNVNQTTAPTENNVDLAAEYNDHEESYNFDFSAAVGSGYTIYAAQGLWDVDGDGDYTETGTVKTPWSLISQTSS